MQGIIFFFVIFFLVYFKIDLENILKTLFTKFPIISPEYITKYIDIIKPALISMIVIGIQKLIYNISFLKTGFFITVSQTNKKTNESFTIINQTNIIESNRTVNLNLQLHSKKSWRNYILKKIIKNKQIYLDVFLEEIDKDYLTLLSDDGDIENSYIKFDITSYFNQILYLNTTGTENFKYIIQLELEPSQEKKKLIIIDSKLLIGNQLYEDIIFFKFFKLNKLIKLEYCQHTVDLNKEEE